MFVLFFYFLFLVFIVIVRRLFGSLDFFSSVFIELCIFFIVGIVIFAIGLLVVLVRIFVVCRIYYCKDGIIVNMVLL